MALTDITKVFSVPGTAAGGHGCPYSVTVPTSLHLDVFLYETGCHVSQAVLKTLHS